MNLKQKCYLSGKQIIIYIAAVNFLFQVIFVFPLLSYFEKIAHMSVV